MKKPTQTQKNSFSYKVGEAIAAVVMVGILATVLILIGKLIIGLWGL